MFKLINSDDKVNHCYNYDEKRHWKKNYFKKNKWNTVTTMINVFNKNLKND